jgi:hypothetical protein
MVKAGGMILVKNAAKVLLYALVSKELGGIGLLSKKGLY